MLGQGLDETRLLGVVPQSCAKFVNGFIKTALEVDKSVFRPQSFVEFFPRHHLAGTLQQQHERLKRLFLQIDLGALPAQLAGSSINLEEPETD
jgi:hypothetical protein